MRFVATGGVRDWPATRGNTTLTRKAGTLLTVKDFQRQLLGAREAELARLRAVKYKLMRELAAVEIMYPPLAPEIVTVLEEFKDV
jgi:hypothetical protein